MPFIGRPVPRLEDPRLLRGRGEYTDDVTLPGQVYAAFVRSPHPHADIRAINSRAALGMPGVLAVLTGADYLADGCGGIPHGPVPADAVEWDQPHFGPLDGVAPFTRAHLPLAVDRARYLGEAVAVVIAETAAEARDAADALEVEYAIRPAVVDARDALRPGAPLVWDEVPGNLAVQGEFGDEAATQRALADAGAVIVDHDFVAQRIVNAQMEPRAALGAYESETDSYLMIAGSQGVVRQRLNLAGALKVPPERVRVICPDVGGGFGPRTALYAEQVVIVWATRRVGRPVRWTSDRTEAFLADYQARDAQARARLALDADGRVRALEVDLVYNVGGQAVSYVPLGNAARVLTSIYAIPAAHVRVRGVLTNTVPTGPYRGAGRPEATFVLERMLDLAAERLGVDRLELRRRNLIPHTALPYRSPLGLTYDSGDFVANMADAAELADWAGFERRRAAAEARGKRAGIGLANYVEVPVGAPHERVKVVLQPDGFVDLTIGTQSSGQGHATSFAQVVTDLLGVTPGRVRLVGGDTDVVVSGGGTHSDRSMRFAGTLLVDACQQIRAAQANGQPPPLSGEAAFTGRIPAYPTGCAVCELEIDPETGHLEITRYTSVDDVGQPVNPLIVDGQIHGGIVQGLGQALREGVAYDPDSGQVLTASFGDYALPRASGLPMFDVALAEDPTHGNPLRLKGAGESGTLPSLAAAVNAAADALGVQDLDMPLSPARVWRAVEQSRGRAATGPLDC